MNVPTEVLTVRRDCPATSVPYGEPATIETGMEVRVLQALGGNVTVRDCYGRLYRVAGADADALGMDPLVADTVDTSQPFSMDLVWDALRTVYDPEMSLNVVELGLVYRCDEILDAGRRTVSIDMTMTAPGCGMGDVLRDDALRAVGGLPGVDDVDVTIVFDPPWRVERMPEDVRLSLGLL